MSTKKTASKDKSKSSPKKLTVKDLQSVKGGVAAVKDKIGQQIKKSNGEWETDGPEGAKPLDD